MITEREALYLIRQKHYRLEITAEEGEYGRVYIILSNKEKRHKMVTVHWDQLYEFSAAQVNCLSFAIRRLVENMVKEEEESE